MSAKITNDHVVEIHYVLTNEEGEVIDQSTDEPLKYLHGHSNIIVGLEEELVGKSVGDSFKATIPPEKAYGTKNDEMKQTVEKSAFGDTPIEIGMQVAATTDEGDQVPFVITNIEDDKVTIDGNHPLADLTLVFDVKVASIRPAAKEEIEHGHVH